MTLGCRRGPPGRGDAAAAALPRGGGLLGDTRIGEAIALRRGDLDLTTGTLSIERQQVEVAGQGPVLVAPKASSQRTGHLPEPAREAPRRPRPPAADRAAVHGPGGRAPAGWPGAVGLAACARTGGPADSALPAPRRTDPHRTVRGHLHRDHATRGPCLLCRRDPLPARRRPARRRQRRAPVRHGPRWHRKHGLTRLLQERERRRTGIELARTGYRPSPVLKTESATVTQGSLTCAKAA
jgi:hypothetical protein